MILIEIISHLSFFIIFLTIFYVNYVGVIQSRSMVNEITEILKDTFLPLLILISPQGLSEVKTLLISSKTIADPALDSLVEQETESNKKLLTPVYVGVFIAATVGILVSIIATSMYGGSIFELFYTNLISLSFIAIADFIIVALYGQFRLLDTQFLVGMGGMIGGGQPPKCDFILQTLDEMFPIPFIQNIIKNFLSYMGEIPQDSS